MQRHRCLKLFAVLAGQRVPALGERDLQALRPRECLRWQRKLLVAGAALDHEGGLGGLELEVAALGTWRGI